MSKVKLLQITVVILILINVGILGLWYFKAQGKKNHKPEKRKMENVVADKLHLSDEQKVIYNNLTGIHRSSVGPLYREIHHLRNELLDGLKHEEGSSQREAEVIAQEIAEKQKEIELLRFHHFQEIKEMLHEDQFEFFEKFIDDMENVMNRTGRRYHQKRNTP